MKNIINKWSKTDTGNIIAFLILLWLISISFILLWVIVPEPNRDFINILIGALIARSNTIIDFFFGTSKNETKTTDMNYDQVTYTQRMAINVQQKGIGYACYQVDSVQGFQIGYYQINQNFGWDYVGTRPPHRID